MTPPAPLTEAEVAAIREEMTYVGLFSKHTVARLLATLDAQVAEIARLRLAAEMADLRDAMTAGTGAVVGHSLDAPMRRDERAETLAQEEEITRLRVARPSCAP